jgi:hypothetical protein
MVCTTLCWREKDSKFRFREGDSDVKRVIEPHWLAAFRCVPESECLLRRHPGPQRQVAATSPPSRNSDPQRNVVLR